MKRVMKEVREETNHSPSRHHKRHHGERPEQSVVHRSRDRISVAKYSQTAKSHQREFYAYKRRLEQGNPHQGDRTATLALPNAERPGCPATSLFQTGTHCITSAARILSWPAPSSIMCVDDLATFGTEVVQMSLAKRTDRSYFREQQI